MNTNAIAALFLLVVSGIIYAGTSSNDPTWTGNRNVCVGECYETWKETHGGSIASVVYEFLLVWHKCCLAQRVYLSTSTEKT